MEDLIKSVEHLAESIVKTFRTLVKTVKNVFDNIFYALCGLSTSRRVIHLAKCGSSRRIRKKNRNRCYREFMKLIKY